MYCSLTAAAAAAIRCNRYVAESLHQAGLASLLVDLLTAREEQVDNLTGQYRFDIKLLAGRLVSATDWPEQNASTWALPIGYFGAAMFDPAEAHSELLQPRGHRTIGVVYRPQYEAFGNYVPTVLPRRCDALLYLDETRALRPLHVPDSFQHELPESYPSGV